MELMIDRGTTGLQYSEAPPPQGLEAAVECIWTMRAPAEDRAAERVLPDGRLEIVFHLGSGCQRVGPHGWTGQPRGLMVGPMTTSALIRPLGEVDVLGIRLKAAGAGALVATPLSELRDTSAPIADLDIRLPAELWEILGNARTWSERLSLVEESLLKTCSLEKIDDRAAALCRALDSHGGRLPMEPLAASAGISTRTMERLFRLQVGIPPKTLSRIIRLRSVVRQAETCSPASLRDAAFDAGYYDQAHFLKDFKAFGGVSPSTFFSVEDNRMSEAFRTGLPEPPAHQWPAGQ